MREEGVLFVYEVFPQSLSESSYDLILSALFPPDAAAAILAMYPYPADPADSADYDARILLAQLFTDSMFLCPLRNVSLAAISSTSSPQGPAWYQYQFSRATYYTQFRDFCKGVTCHGSELPFIFGQFADGQGYMYNATPGDLSLSRDLSAAWSAFVSTSRPSPAQPPLPIGLVFPAFNASSQALINVNANPWGSVVSQHTRAPYCDLWDTLDVYPRAVPSAPSPVPSFSSSSYSSKRYLPLVTIIAVTLVAALTFLVFLTLYCRYAVAVIRRRRAKTEAQQLTRRDSRKKVVKNGEVEETGEEGAEVEMETTVLYSPNSLTLLTEESNSEVRLIDARTL